MRQTTGARSWAISRAEDLFELERRGDVQLIVAAVARLFVGPPSEERRRVPETVALQVVVFDLAHSFDTQWFPRQVFAGTPAALAAAHAREIARVDFGPFPPRMIVERRALQRGELADEVLPDGHREGGRHADMVQPSPIVVEPEQQRTDAVASALVPSKAGDDTVRASHVL